MKQFKALFIKNWILWKRGLIGSLLEICLPIAIFCIFFALRSSVTITSSQESQLIGNSTYTVPITS